MLVSDGQLGHEPEDAEAPRILDLYAGSGALALEALSRGASGAVLVEHARDAIAAIRENTRALGAEEFVQVLPMKVDRALLKIEGTFGVVFLDPPYADVRARGFAEIMAGAARLLAPDGVVVLEHASSDDPPAVPGLDVDRSRRHGDTTLTFYRAQNPASRG